MCLSVFPLHVFQCFCQMLSKVPIADRIDRESASFPPLSCPLLHLFLFFSFLFFCLLLNVMQFDICKLKISSQKWIIVASLLHLENSATTARLSRTSLRRKSTGWIIKQNKKVEWLQRYGCTYTSKGLTSPNWPLGLQLITMQLVLAHTMYCWHESDMYRSTAFPRQFSM